MAKYVCSVCGYVHEGDSAPERCPQCRVPAEKFNEVKEENRYWAAEHVLGVAKGAPEEIIEGLRYNFEGECLQTTKYEDSNGETWESTTNCCPDRRINTVKNPTCTQDGEGFDQCVLCGKCSEPYTVGPNDHNWVYIMEGWYHCYTCGIKNTNGVSGSIIMEDLTEEYGDGEYYVVGYYAQNDVKFSKYISLLFGNDEEVAIWEGIEFIEVDGLRAYKFSKASVEEWAAANGYTDYKVKFFGRTFKCLDAGFEPNEPVDVVIRPEDIDIVEPSEGSLTGTVASVTFKGLNYDIIVEVKGFKWLIQTTDFHPEGSVIGIRLNPEDIHIMKKSEYSGMFGDYSSYSAEYDELTEDAGDEEE